MTYISARSSYFGSGVGIEAAITWERGCVVVLNEEIR